MSLDGGAVETLAMGQTGPSSITLDADNVYWTAGDGTVASVPKKGGTKTVLAQVVNGNAVAGSIAVDDENVYFTAGALVAGIAKDGTASATTMIAASEVNARSLHVTSSLVWAEDGAIREDALKSGTPNNLVPSTTANALAIAPSHLVWTEVGAGIIHTAATDGSNLFDIMPAIDTTMEALDAVVANDDNVYFTTTAGTLRVVPLSQGATPQIVVQGTAGSMKLAMDANNVYVGNAADGSIIAIPQ